MSKIKSLVAKFLSLTLMSSSCFTAKTNALHINKNYGKSIRYSRKKIKNGDRVPNSKVQSGKVKASHNKLSSSKKDLNSSLKSRDFVDKPIVNGVINTSVVSKSDNKFTGRKHYRAEKIKKNDNGSVQRNANFQVKGNSSVSSAKRDVVNFKGNAFLRVAEKTGNWIKNNPKKSASAFVGTAAMGTFVGNKIKDNLEKDNIVFDQLKEIVKNRVNTEKYVFIVSQDLKENCGEELENNEDLIFLFRVSKILHSIITKNNYSLLHTVLRRIKDMFLTRGATTRQRKSVERFMETGQGTCWEAAQIFDFCCRKLGLERHHIVVSHLAPGIYHTFNVFKLGGNWYLCDPLGGILKKFADAQGNVDIKVLAYWCSFDLYYAGVNAGKQPFGGYILDQINDDTFKTLGMMKMAPFGPSFYDKKLLGDNDFMKYDYNKHEIRLDVNVKFNEYSSILFG